MKRSAAPKVEIARDYRAIWKHGAMQLRWRAHASLEEQKRLLNKLAAAEAEIRRLRGVA